MKLISLDTSNRSVQVVAALLIGTLGGATFAYLRLPLPWMTGAATLTTICALSGAPLQLPKMLRAGMASILGVMLGSAFLPGTLDHLPQWSGSIAGLLVYIILGGGIVLWYVRSVRGYPPVTSFFSATPGGFLEMVLLAENYRADVRTVALMHSVRIFLTVFTIPIWFRFTQGYEPSATGLPAHLGADLTTQEGVILFACAVFGYWGGVKLRIPAPFLLGPMLLSAVLHLTGVTHTSPPGVVVALAQIVIGTSVGCRFTGYSIKSVFRTLVSGAVAAIILLVLAAGFAMGLAPLTGIPWQVLLLAFAPGGLAEMSLVSFAMGIDPALVSSHHLIRIMFIVILTPIAFRVLRRWMGSLNASVDERSDVR